MLFPWSWNSAHGWLAGWRDGLVMDGRWMNGRLDGRHNLYLYHLLILLYYFDTAQFQFSVLVFKQLSLIDGRKDG